MFDIDKQYEEILRENVDMSNIDAVKYLANLNESGKDQLLESLTSKLYDKIVAKIDDIDFGTIPQSRGDITRVENYEQMKECVDIIREIVKVSGEKTEPVDVISAAMGNIENNKATFIRAYSMDVEMGIIMYNSLVLGMVRSISLLIATSIEFIKTPANTFEMSLDRVSYRKTADSMLFNDLRKFNQSCKKGEFDRCLNQVITNAGKKNFVGSVGGAGAALIIGVITAGFLVSLAKNLLPMLQDLVYIFYSSKQTVSDYFAVQSELLDANIDQLSYRDDIDDARRAAIIAKQRKAADKFKRLSNTFTIDMKTAERDATELANSESRKYSVDTTATPSDALF